MSLEKGIRLEKNVWKALKTIKDEKELKSFNEAVKTLLKERLA